MNYFIYSAILLMLSYQFVAYAWWCIFFAYALLFFALWGRSNDSYALARGSFVWGATIYGFHVYPFILLARTHGTWLAPFFLVFLLVYLALWPMIWFVCTDLLLRSMRLFWLKQLFWVASLCFFTHCIDRYSFFIFGEMEGYGALHPLVTLMQVAWYRSMLWHLGQPGCTMLFFVYCACIARITVLLVNSGCALRLCIVPLNIALFALVILPGYIYRATIVLPEWFGKIAAVSSSLRPQVCSRQWDNAHELYTKISEVLKRRPEVELIIMPESTCCFALNEFPEIIKFWQEHLRAASGHPVSLILGSHRSEGGGSYNTLYYLYGNARYTYDKPHGLIGAERIPAFAHTMTKQTLFTSGKIFTQSRANQKGLLWKDQVWAPYICSEIFFAKQPRDGAKGADAIVCIANDAWYEGTFLPKILMLTAICKAASWQKNLLYVAQEHAFYGSIGGYVAL